MPWGIVFDHGLQGDEYFIRSSVLGGAVISEVGPTGKKKKTSVYAAGATIATQTEHVYNSTLYKNVRFEHTDSSGMTNRSTMTTGVAYIYGGNYEGAPVEADPMGGNMSTETPYVEEPPEPPPPGEDFPAFSVTEADPVYVNGHRVPMVVDGMSVPFAVGMGYLDNRHGSLGLDLLEFSAEMSRQVTGVRVTGVSGGHKFDAELRVDGTQSIWIGSYDEDLHNLDFGTPTVMYNNNWSAINLLFKHDTIPVKQDAIPGFKKWELTKVQGALNEAKKLLAKKECQDGLAKAGIDVAKLTAKLNGLKPRPQSDPNRLQYNIFDAEKSSDVQVQNFLKTPKGMSAGAFVWGQNIMVRDAFFNARGGARVGPESSRALALIHEAVHLTGMGDADFGGSAKLNDMVVKACYGAGYGHKDLSIVGN